MKKIDVIIAGLGISGAAMALQLLKRRKSFVVFDSPSGNISSSQAAGLFNPVAGKMMNKAWKADVLFPLIPGFYQEAESTTGKKFFHPAPVCIPFLSIAEQNDWMIKAATPGLINYVEQTWSSGHFSREIHDPLGGVMLKSCGYVNTPVYLEAVRSLLRQNDSYEESVLDPRELILDNDTATYRGHCARHVVFCQGMRSLTNAFFSWLPVLPLKGETLEVHFDENPSVIFNRRVYVVPSGSAGHNVGATYDRTDMPGVTEAGKEELLSALNGLVKIPYTVTGHRWGIRPSTHDRRPILGRHPVHPNLLVFNGMGTKGISQTPYFSSHLAGHLFDNGEIEREVNIRRYYPLYSKS